MLCRKKLVLLRQVLFTVLIFTSLSFASTLFDGDVEIIKSDNSGVTLRYIVPSSSFTPFEAGNEKYYSLNIDRTAQNRTEGQTLIPLKIVPLALPPGAIAKIQVIDANYKDVEFKKIAPFFARSSQEEYERAYNDAALKSEAVQGNPYIASYENLRGLKIARIGIPTARYSDAPPGLSLLQAITIRVDFVGAATELSGSFRHPGNAFNTIFSKVVANYDVGRDWTIQKQKSGLETAVALSVFDSASTWIRMELTTEGIYSIGWYQFQSLGISPIAINPSRVRIFYGGGRELPIDNSQPRPELREIPIEIIGVGGTDTTFDNGDLIVFYADGVDGWEFNSTANDFIRYKNHYASKNVFWLTIDGNFSGPAKRYENWDGSPNGAYDISTDSYTAMLNREEDILFWKSSPSSIDNHDYFEWYWASGRSFSTSAQLYDVVLGGTAKIIIRHKSGSLSLNVNNAASTLLQQYPDFSIFSTANLREGSNNIAIQSNSSFYTDYVNIHYPRWLRTIDGNLRFSQPDTFGVIRYNLTNADTANLLLDISDKMNPVKITGGSLSGQNLMFHDTVSAQSHKQYYFSNRNRFRTPGAMTLYQIDNLKDVNLASNRADEIILTYDGFYDQAERLAQHRQSVYGLAARIVKISDVYNQFSYGLMDAVAIRDFLKYAYENWQAPAPSYVVLLGDGNYDYRNYMGSSPRNYIPPYEYIPLSDNVGGMTDERFIYLGSYGNLDSDSNSYPDMMIGRISAKSSQDASEMIDKIIDYDSNPDLGSWRNRVVVVADDNLHPPYAPTEDFHTTQAESLANRHIPNSFETGKIYMVEYPMGTGGEKPQARDALMSAFNQGSLIINWIGHGSAGLWADEHIFRRIEDIPRLRNGKRLPLVFTASCSIGAFDIPAFESMAEELARTNGRGAIAVISATRAVFAGANGQFNNAVFDQLLYSDSVGIGAAVYIAKFLRQGGGGTNTNDRLFMLFGDPVQLLQFPKYKVRFTSVPDSLAALTENEVSGEIVNGAGNIMTDFNGTVWINVKDGTTLRSVIFLDAYNNPLPPPNNTVSFIKSGATIFQGPADVVNGHFTGRFFTPKDISYGSSDARIYAYGENGVYDAIGVADSIRISGSMPTEQDSTGPTMNLFVDGRPFRQEITQVPSDFVLTADITDDHGINITGQLGHGIVFSFDDGREFEMDITGNFSYGRGNYQGGTLTFQTPNLPLGQHTLSLKAWDNFNNSTLATYNIEAVSTQNLALSNVMNYPNPVKGNSLNTSFQYCLNENADKVIIKIFTEAGRKIKTLEFTSPEYTQMDCHQVDWNLRDGDGDPIADGIYLYKVIAEKQDGNGSRSEADDTRKLVILR